MHNETTFNYSYSAKENTEVQAIRRKYLPKAESKFDELRRLDRQVQSAGMTEALTVGILGCLLFGLGLCVAMEVIGSSLVLGVLLGLVGMAGMLAAYPVHRLLFGRARAKWAPRILELSAELSGNSR